MLPLRTERLVIRMMRGPDTLRFVAYRNDPQISRFQDWELPFTDEAAARVVDGQAALERPTSGQWVQLAVDLGDEMVGDVAVELRADGAVATIGYTFAAKHHSRGYATESVSAVVDALCAAGVHRFVATLDPENVPSMRVLEAVGFTFECVARRAELVRGEWVDDLRYAMLADDRRAWRERVRTPPTDVVLVPLDDDNVAEFYPLATHHSQERFVRPLIRALAHVAFPLHVRGLPFTSQSFGVRADGVPVGFVQLADCSATHDEPYVWRLIIDRWHQRRGIGTRVLQAAADRTRAAGHHTLLIAFGDGPGSPGPVYRAFGFEPIGEVVDGEVVARLAL
jgi:RimJ/RimL family protein N-acetyltransferase